MTSMCKVPDAVYTQHSHSYCYHLFTIMHALKVTVLGTVDQESLITKGIQEFEIMIIIYICCILFQAHTGAIVKEYGSTS